MESWSKRIGPIIYIAVLSGVICALTRSLSLLFLFDGHIGYYSRGAVLPIISDILFFVFAAALATVPFIMLKKSGKIAPPSGNIRYAAILPAIAFILPVADALTAIVAKADILTVLSLISAVGALAFFALIAFSKECRTDLSVICGTCVIVYLALCWLRSYTDFLVPMNSPDKIFFNLACVGAAMLAVGELKAICGSASPRGYICYLSLSILSLFAYAVPYAVEALGGVEGVRSSTLGESAVLFGLLIYACARALALINDKKIAKED